MRCTNLLLTYLLDKLVIYCLNQKLHFCFKSIFITSTKEGGNVFTFLVLTFLVCLSVFLIVCLLTRVLENCGHV